VQQIEVAVSQDDALAGTTPLLHLFAKLIAAQDFAFCAQ